ncbi:MAG: T9SS type A sorting domain-containing protein [Prevotellaceae bacterium]|jgi:hypothetical protein|nr:T9SS type A sorting domain-containing protein [Prevotellaceae bacterium]
MKKIILFTNMLLLSTGFGNKLFAAYSGNGAEGSPYPISSKADMEQSVTDVDGEEYNCYLTLKPAVGCERMGTVVGEGYYPCNTQVDIMAIANVDYHFLKWDDNIPVNPRTVTITQDTTFTAVFEENRYVLTVEVAKGCEHMGSVTGGGEYAHNAQAVITAIPANEDYRFVRWEESTGTSSTDNPYYIVMTSAVGTFTAVFEDAAGTDYTLTVTSNDVSWGMVAVEPAGLYTYGQEVTLTPNAASGYRFVKWNDNTSDNPRTVTVTQDTIFTAEFAANPVTPTYTLTVTSNNDNWGMVVVDPAGLYTYGQEVVLTANADNGYRFVKWNDNTSDNPRTITVTQDTTFTAVFAANPVTPTYTLTVTSNNPDWGTVAVNSAGPYTYAQEVVLTANAVNGCRFVKWDDNVTANPRTVAVTRNMTFEAEFVKENTGATYQITVRSSDTNMGTVDGGGRYAEGEEVMLMASPKSGYHFDRWQDKNTDNPRLIIVTANATYIAVFAEGSDDTSESPTPSDDTVVVYPNPARNVLYIRSAVAIEQVVIRDLSGQQVKRFTAPVGSEIDVSDLSAGVYLVGITTANGDVVRKIVIND